MNTEELAKEHDVPLPETCKELDWQKSTLFVWLNCPDEGGIILCNPTQVGNLTKNGIKFEEIALAPQFRQIAKSIGYADGYIGIKENRLMTDWHSVEINDFHFSQAAAELYLKLKKKGELV